MYQGEFFQVVERNQFAELVFDMRSSEFNVLTKEALLELSDAITVIEKSAAKGLIIRSAKSTFSVGANIKAFQELFLGGQEVMSDYISWAQGIYSRLEELNIPKVAIVNGVAAGGAVELSLLAEYRLVTTDVKMGLPEVKLGVLPGWGGLTRLPRICGLDTSLEWFTTGKNFRADKLIKQGVADGVVDPKENDPIAKAEQVLISCIEGQFDWQARRKEKQQPLKLDKYELNMSINVAKGMVARAAGKHYPTAMIILETLEKAAYCERDAALALEIEGVNRCVDTGVADALVNVAVADLVVNSVSKKWAKKEQAHKEIGVIGAGIMGGGIAYVTADKGMDVVMKDINKSGLVLGLNEANKLLTKQVSKGRKKPEEMGQVLNRIMPTLHNNALENSDIIIEAVVENPKVKQVVLGELEKVAPNAILASNTSTLMISGLASKLKRPENFCGIHFFNPVHMMPLVEVIRGEKTSESTIAKAVKYVAQLGKKPIVINDCAGFLVNRCLAPYFLALNKLLLDGGDLAVIDKVMKKDFGWPMGPANLLDVIGLDTAAHCIDVMDDAFPGRMTKPEVNTISILAGKNCFGQKNGQGYHQYKPDRRGKMRLSPCAETEQMLLELRGEPAALHGDTIMMRMMLPMMFEAIRCLDEGIISSPEEGDIAMIYGTGFPPFRGGLFYYMDKMGLAKVLEITKEYEHLGELYQAPEGLVSRVQNNQTFYA
ncbi:fatty acid oxidation complex subunit alpha FadB [Vibrio sp. VB16]|uniref:fatty acid oxidation complex subunit alpha FadB n=1 Tax=Vibrio sp. VB16 TaxID=2785746 RepID=UPI00189DDF82|nr:fatty acid oxidation complex subunit alpha FadB [Vibrio sp. VB16]UGA53666.1 fatty acid oxidation complex subunit alpha FadB [Vibrio sp. VB16]